MYSFLAKFILKRRFYPFNKKNNFLEVRSFLLVLFFSEQNEKIKLDPIYQKFVPIRLELDYKTFKLNEMAFTFFKT